MAVSLVGVVSFTSNPRKLDIDFSYREASPLNQSIIEPPKLVLKALPSFLWYIFLRAENILAIIMAIDLEKCQVSSLISILKKNIKSLRCSIADIVGISLGVCTHKIH